MISHFFIDRPIFASVLSIVFVLAGGVAVFTLPVAQYPEVTPPTVLVTALYPGANAVTVRNVVAAPIEEQVSGVEGMLYMSSQSTNDGAYRLAVTFRLGMDSDMAQVLVQNRVSLALPVIPALVQNEGINVKKVSPSTMMIVNLVSPDGRYDATFLSNYATIYLRDELGRLPGVADITYFGQRDYSLRAWLDPDKMAALGLSAGDVVLAISQQNLQIAAGQIGQQPVPKGQQFHFTINTLGRLTDPQQFADIILKAGTPAPGAAGGQSAGNGGSGSQGAGATQGGSGTTGSAGGSTAAASTAQTSGTQALPPATGVVRLRNVARVEPRLAAVRSVLHPGRQAQRRAVHLPASRLERLGYRQGNLRQDEGARRADSPTVWITRSSTTRRPSFGNRSTRCFTPCATRSSWLRWLCWPSCRTGGRP